MGHARTPLRDLPQERLMIRLRLFFFSSGRRHTRCSRDWSSDVCSSDLTLTPTSRDHISAAFYNGEDVLNFFRDRNGDGDGYLTRYTSGNSSQSVKWQHTMKNRSEERRVGKSVDHGGRRMNEEKIRECSK